MDKKWVLSLCIVSLLIGYIGSGLMHDEFHNDYIDMEERRENSGAYRYINPLLECDDVELSSKVSAVGLRKKIDSYIEQKKTEGSLSHVSTYYRDLNAGPWVGVNEKEFFSPASMIKVPVMIAYFKLAETDPSVLTKLLSFNEPTQSATLVQQFKPSIVLEKQKPYTVAELIERMIVYSDNTAYDLLLNSLDNRILYKVYEDMGIDINTASKKDPNGNILTVRDNAAFYRVLYNASYLGKRYSETALSILAKSDFKRALRSGVPENIAVAHKFGERAYLAGEKQFHDCGIVYLPSHPYLLCVMTRGNDSEKLIGSIADISKIVYEYARDEAKR